MDPLARKFLDLPAPGPVVLLREAKRKAEQGICFLCSWITGKKRFEDFPRESRMVHLMLCCHGESLSDSK